MSAEGAGVRGSTRERRPDDADVSASTPVTASAEPDTARPLARVGDRLLPAAVIGILVTTVYAAYSWRQWHRFESPSWDLGIFTQIFRAYSELRRPVVPIKGEDFMILGDHFHPLLALLAPTYWIAPSGLTLLVVQAALIGASAAVLTATGVRHLGRWPGLAIGLAYGLSWGLQSAVASQFHEVALALPFLAASLAALIRGSHLAAAAWALPLLGVKEDLGLTVAAIGVVLAIRGSRRLGVALAATGAAAFVLTTRVILPALNPDGVWDYADDSIVATLFEDPAAAFTQLATGADTKGLLVLMTVVVTGLVAMRSPLLLIALPTFAWRLSSDVPFHWSLDWHYSAVLMTITFMAMIDALHRSRRLAPLTTWFAVAAVVLAVAVTTQFPLRELSSPSAWQDGPRVEGAQAALAAVPDDVRVVSDITLMAYLVPRTQVYWMGNDNPVPDYVVLYQGSGTYGGAPPSDAAAWAQDRFPGEEFTEVLSQDGFLVARRG